MWPVWFPVNILLNKHILKYLLSIIYNIYFIFCWFSSFSCGMERKLCLVIYLLMYIVISEESEYWSLLHKHEMVIHICDTETPLLFLFDCIKLPQLFVINLFFPSGVIFFAVTGAICEVAPNNYVKGLI